MEFKGSGENGGFINFLFACSVVLHIFLSSADFFKINFFIKILLETLSECQTVWIKDHDRHSVGPDLGPNSFAKAISRRQKLPLARKE